MKKIHILLKYCHGIKKLDKILDFSDKKTFCFYSQNGVMKTSLAKTFKDFKENRESKDEIFQDNQPSERKIVDENKKGIGRDNVFVIDSMDMDYKSEEALASLIVNKESKKKYENIHKELDVKLKNFMSLIRLSTGLKQTEIQAKFSKDFEGVEKNIYEALAKAEQQIDQNSFSNFTDVVYNEIFNNTAVDILSKDKDLQKEMDNYIKNLDEITKNSTFFKKNFNHNHADSVAKNLKENHFFEADHYINVGLGLARREVKKAEDLREIIEEEKKLILNNDELKKSFEKIDKILTKNKGCLQFRNSLRKNPMIIRELNDIGSFRQKIWLDLIKNKNNRPTFDDLLSSYNKSKEQLNKIIQEARREQTKWKRVVEIFNKRFSVPFRIEIDNQEDVILKSEIPILKFIFRDHENSSREENINRDQLKSVLSHGEKRAFYILNILFEIESIKEKNQETIFIIDDIADSFDYKNKYAIIEYLKEIGENEQFKQIILTHNYDFFRTVSSRLGLGSNAQITFKDEEGKITFHSDKTVNNFFIFSHWKNKLNDPNRKFLISLIPCLRNLMEIIGDSDSKEKIIGLIHIKNGITENFKISDLEDIIKDIFNDQDTLILPERDKIVKDVIYEEADDISNDITEDPNLEEKIVLSIAIRLKAEEYIITKINPEFLNDIKRNQTYELINYYKTRYPQENDINKTLDRVCIMTPENIHLNSFMYEPIMDMSSVNLKRLYKDVSNLKK